MVTLSSMQTIQAPPCPRVEILGVFGAGKTTLAKRLTSSEHTHLAEDHQLNPFWGNERSIRVTGYLPYDLSFLIQHAYLLSSVRDQGVAVCDWSFITDRLWASKRLQHDLPTYDTVYQAITTRFEEPSGYLYLRHSPETIRQRLAKRSRRGEESFRADVESAFELLEVLTATIPPERMLIVSDDFDKTALESWLSKLEGSPK
jgi:deoxyadenosine/deoxycytidine kinase